LRSSSVAGTPLLEENHARTMQLDMHIGIGVQF